MTSLIFGAIYLTHKGATGAYRDKQRQKAYERWEGLRDEYDAQKKITRDTRSFDMEQTGNGAPFCDDGPIMTLRDPQEANDARTSWRPQESWESVSDAGLQDWPPSATRLDAMQRQARESPLDRSESVPSAYWAARGEIKPQRTGATWDDGLPAPLKVSRRLYEGRDFNQYQNQRSRSVQADSFLPATRADSATRTLGGFESAGSAAPQASATYHRSSASTVSTLNQETPQNETPGGPMAQLIEGGF